MSLVQLVLLALMSWLGQAHAFSAGVSNTDGVPVTVTVLDEEGDPIPTAVIRHPLEADRNPVNAYDGRWTASVLYLPDGSELVFERGMDLELEISAPGYVNERVTYTIRRRRNNVTVTLTKMDLSADDDKDDGPAIQFGRDRPLDGRPIDED